MKCGKIMALKAAIVGTVARGITSTSTTEQVLLLFILPEGMLLILFLLFRLMFVDRPRNNHLKLSFYAQFEKHFCCKLFLSMVSLVCWCDLLTYLTLVIGY